jgi:hypothetical protein
VNGLCIARATGTAEATPQGKMMNPSRLGTGKAVVETANAKAKNRSVAMDPLAATNRRNNGERNKHKDVCKVKQSNKIELSKEAFARLVRDTK